MDDLIYCNETEVNIKCSVEEGLFSTEYGVEILNGSDVISLFVDCEFVFKDGEDYYIRAQRINDDYVLLPGERTDLGSQVIQLTNTVTV